MEHGFSTAPHHGLELSGGDPEADGGSAPAADTGAAAAAAPTPTADVSADEPVSDPEHVEPKHNLMKLSSNQYKTQKTRLKKQPITVVFNESKLILTKDMENVLNRGLKFAIIPHKLDITQVLTEFRRFERTMVWTEFGFGKPQGEQYEPPLFKQKKSNFPRNNRPHKNLQDYLAAVRSKIMDPKNCHTVKSNISEWEKEALKELVTRGQG